LVIAHDDPANPPSAIDEQTHLSVNFMGQAADFSGKFESDDLIGRNTAAIEFFEPARLVGL
jgi:hypothetical protein